MVAASLTFLEAQCCGTLTKLFTSPSPEDVQHSDIRIHCLLFHSSPKDLHNAWVGRWEGASLSWVLRGDREGAGLW